MGDIEAGTSQTGDHAKIKGFGHGARANPTAHRSLLCTATASLTSPVGFEAGRLHGETRQDGGEEDDEMGSACVRWNGRSVAQAGRL
jgi:hypothetical protein